MAWSFTFAAYLMLQPLLHALGCLGDVEHLQATLKAYFHSSSLDSVFKV